MDSNGAFGAINGSEPAPIDAKGLEVYELNLEKYKDKGDAVQKKTFTKWVNKHLKRANEDISDLFAGFQSGTNLILLLEILTGEQLQREKGCMRFHRLQNVQTCLAFLRERKVKLVNIRAEDIVDGNPKLTMGLIWTIILHFQVSEPWSEERTGSTITASEGLLDWVQRVTRAYYPAVNVTNFSTRWSDGLAFCAILHHYRPALINWREVLHQMTPHERMETSFALFEREFGITRLLDAEDVDVNVPDEKSVMTYVSSLYNALDRVEVDSYEQEFSQYCSQAQSFRTWLTRWLGEFEERLAQASPEAINWSAEVERFRAVEMAARLGDKRKLEKLHARLEQMFAETAHMNRLEPPLHGLQQLWERLVVLVGGRERGPAAADYSSATAAEQVEREVGALNETLDALLRRIEDAQDRGQSLGAAELQALLEGIVNDLNRLEAPVERLFKSVEQLMATGHPEGNKLSSQVFGLHQRRIAYLRRLNATYLLEPGARTGEYSSRFEQERYARTRDEAFSSVKKCIEWVEQRLVDMADMTFRENAQYLEELLENHKLVHRDVMDFRLQVDQCIARQAEVGAEDADDYCNHLSTLEKEYHQLRELSTGRMLDLDSLIAFVRSAQMELLWIGEREEVEVARDWSHVEMLDLAMLRNYYKQLMHEIELREGQFNVVHDQGAALVNQRHPAVEVIEAYLNTMHSQWDWLLGLTQCLESHLHDAVNLQEFLDDAASCELWMERKLDAIEVESSRGTLSADEGDRVLDELADMRDVMERYHDVLLSLAERSRTISPLWQRGEPVASPIGISALCNYIKKEAVIRKGDQCALLDNSESLTSWSIRTEDGHACDVPSVIFRIPPPDERIGAYYQRLQSMFDRLRRSWLELNQATRFAQLSKSMREVCSWDVKQLQAIDPESSRAIIMAINDDVNKLLDELDKNDPMAVQLGDELNATNEHFYKLLQQTMREPDTDLADSFEKKAMSLIEALEEAWRVLKQRVASAIPKNAAQLDTAVDEHKAFEDALQARDSDVTTLQELFRQLRQPSPLHRSLLDQVMGRWQDLWELAKLYAERLKSVEMVLTSVGEASDICLAHERSLGSYDAMPAQLDKLRAVHAQLLEMQLVLQQQQPVFQDLASNVAKMRQYVSHTRPSIAEHVDVDQAEEIVQLLTVRWENICKQVIDRLKSAELATPILLVYRGAYEDATSWLDRVERTIGDLRQADALLPEEYQEQLDLLLAEYSTLNERTATVENVNREGGRFIREGKLYDTNLAQYKDVLSDTSQSVRFEAFSTPTGCQAIRKELDDLNHRFSQLTSVILERRNVIQVLMQNWRRQKEEEERRRQAVEEAARRAEDEARRRAEDEAERLRRLKEEEERRRRAAEDEAERLRRLRDEEEARRQAEEARRRAEEEAKRLAEEARRRAEEEARRRAAEEARYLADLEAARHRDEEEARRRAAEEARRLREEEEARRRAQEEADRLRALRDREHDLKLAEEEARRRAEEEARRRADEESRRRADEEARRRAEEEARRRADEEARRRAEEEARRRADEEARRRAEEEARRRADEEEARRKAQEEAKRQKPLDIKTGREWGEAVEWGEAGNLEEAGDLAGVAKISEHEEDMIMYAEETEVRTKFFELEAVKHLQTGEILTFVEAARQGVLDLQSGEFFDVVSGSRISLEEAVRRGFVSQSLTECLNTHYGLRNPENGQPVTLLEAIQIGLYDPEIRQLKNPKSEEALSLFDASRMGVVSMDNVHKLIKMGLLKLPPLSLQQAIEQALIDLQTGTFIGRFSRETLPLTEALRHGYVSLSTPSARSVGVSLTECIEQRYIDPVSGEFVDRKTGDKFTLAEALKKSAPLINLDTREIVHTAERRRITVGEAAFRNVLNVRLSNFTDTQHRQAVSLLDAYEKELIQRPLTLHDICAKGLIDSSGRFVDGGTKRRMVLLEAIADGLIDADVPHIVDGEEKEIVSLAVAMERGVVTPAGEYVPHNSDKHSTTTIQEAVNAGFIVAPVRYSLFDVKAIRDTKRKTVLSFNEALAQNIVRLDDQSLLDTGKNEMVPFHQLRGSSLIDAVVLNALLQPAGFRGDDTMNVLEAVKGHLIDPVKRVLMNARRQHFTPREAYESGFLSLRGAMLIASLFDVHPSLVFSGAQHVGKPHKRRIQPVGGGSGKAPSVGGLKMTLGEALYQGFVDPKSRVTEGGRDVSLQEAVDTGLLDTSIEWIVPDKGSDFGPTIQESQSETITETSQVMKPQIGPDRHVEESTTTVKRQRVTETTAVGSGGPGKVSAYRAVTGRAGRLEVPLDGLHVYAAQRLGLFQISTGVLTVPDVERQFNFDEALELGIINGATIRVRDRRTSSFVGASEAISAGILDSNGMYKDSLSGRKVNMQEAIDDKLIVVEPEPESQGSSTKIVQFNPGPLLGPIVSFRPTGTSLRETTDTKLMFNAVTGEVVDEQSGEQLSLDEALRRGKVVEDDLVVTDALMERQLTFAEAEKWGVIEANSKMYVNKRLNRICSLQEAVKQGLVTVTFGIASATSDALETHAHRQFRKVVSTKESALAGPAAFVDFSLQRVIELGWYDAASGLFTHPDTKKQMTLKQAIIKGLFNPYESTLVDPASKQHLNLLDAIQMEVLDAERGCVRDKSSGQVYDLEEACRQGIISSGVVAQSLDALIASGRLDLNQGDVYLPDGRSPVSLHDAIAKGLVDPSSICVLDPSNDDQMDYDQAVKRKVVDAGRGLVVNRGTGDAVSFVQAIRSGLIKPLPRSDAARYRMMPSSSSSSCWSFSKPRDVITSSGALSSSPASGFDKAREEMVDIGGKQVMVKVIRDEQGVEKGEYIDPETKMKFTVQLHGDPYTTRTQTSVKSTAQVQSVELSPFAELIGIDKVQDKRSGRVMSLSEAQRAGLASVDRKGKQLTKTYAVFRSDIAHALNHGIVDPTTGERLSLEDAVKSRIVDIEALAMWHPDSGERLDFSQAANIGLMDVTLAEVLPKGVCNPVNGERISIKRAIDLKIINPRNGAVRNPYSNEPLTWVSIVKPVYASLVMEGVYDPRKGYAVPVNRALNEGLIDADKQVYCNPITNEVLALADAAQLGLIDESTYKIMTQNSVPNYKSGQMLSLLQAVSLGLVDTHERTVTIDKGVTVSIGKAVQDGKLPKELGRLLKRVDKLTFAEALGQGLIDVTANQFTDPDSGHKMTISCALEQGYIDTGSVETFDGSDERNLGNVIQSEEFDENSGRIRDKKSGLYLTFKQAIERSLVDADSLIYDVTTGRAMTLNEALNRGRIDFNGKFVDKKTGTKVNLRDAVRVGLIGLIASPMQAAQAAAEAIKRKEAEGVRFSFEPHTTLGGGQQQQQRQPAPRASATLKEQIVSVKISGEEQPQKVFRLQHDDDQMSTMRTGDDLQADFLAHLLESSMRLDEPVVKNPATGQKVSIKEALDKGLLDVASGEIVNPHSGEHYSITRAVQLHLVPPKVGSTIMSALNKSFELREPYSSTSSSSQPQQSFTKEVFWHGKPSELRQSGGDMSDYTKVTGLRSLHYDDSL